MESPLVIGLVIVGVALLLVVQHRSKKSSRKQNLQKDPNLKTRIKTHFQEIGNPKLWTLYEFIESLPPKNREREGAVVRAICYKFKKGRRVAIVEIRILTRILHEDLRLEKYSVVLPRKKDR